MLTDQQLRPFKAKFLIIQVVAMVMFLGALFFAGIIASMFNRDEIGDPLNILNLIGGGTGILLYLISFGATILFPRTPRGIPSPEPNSESDPQTEHRVIDGILDLIKTEYSVRFALMDGGIFLNAMVMMLEPRWVTLAIIAVGFLLMLLRFPLKFRTVSELCQRFEEWNRGASQ